MIHLTFEKNKLWNCVYNQYKGIWSVLNESSINCWTPYFDYLQYIFQIAGQMHVCESI